MCNIWESVPFRVIVTGLMQTTNSKWYFFLSTRGNSDAFKSHSTPFFTASLFMWFSERATLCLRGICCHSVCPSVCLSVTSRSCTVVLKRLYAGSRRQHCTIAQELCTFITHKICTKFRWNLPQREREMLAGGVGKNCVLQPVQISASETVRWRKNTRCRQHLNLMLVESYRATKLQHSTQLCRLCRTLQLCRINKHRLSWLVISCLCDKFAVSDIHRCVLQLCRAIKLHNKIARLNRRCDIGLR